MKLFRLNWVAALWLMLQCRPMNGQQTNQEEPNSRENKQRTIRGSTGVEEGGNEWPVPLAASSYVSPDGLSLVIIMNRPVRLAAWLSATEQHWTIEDDAQEYQESGEELRCPAQRWRSELPPTSTRRQVQGIQLCARLLTRRTLRLLHKFRLHTCLWASRTQFLVRLARQVPLDSGPIRLTFQAASLFGPAGRELTLELLRLPLHSLGVNLSPRLVLNGPNQVPPCGLFSLSAHFSSPYGSEPETAVRLTWRVERLGLPYQEPPPANWTIGESSANSGQSLQIQEMRWHSLERLVAQSSSNNLVLDASLLQNTNPSKSFVFHLSVSFEAPANQKIQLNSSHRLQQLDFHAPIGVVYGSHQLQSTSHLVNPSQELLLITEVQLPQCLTATSIKQVGLFWQVSDNRVKFEQSYAPFYLVKGNSLPEQSEFEFRVNLFYGLDVKRHSSSGLVISTGNAHSSQAEQISGGILVLALADDTPGARLELHAGPPNQPTSGQHLWSCFDGKTGQECRARGWQPSQAANNASSVAHYELANSQSSQRHSMLMMASSGQQQQQPGEPLVGRHNQRDQSLRLPLAWLEPNAQLWFGLRSLSGTSDGNQQLTSSPGADGPLANGQFALVSLQATSHHQQGTESPIISLGPVLLGSGRQPAKQRNPLTGAILVVAGASARIVARLGPSRLVRSFHWRAASFLQPLHWLTRNWTNPWTGELELLSELQLSQSLLVAHAHHQVQLIVCTHWGSNLEASLALDVVASVGQCRVQANMSELMAGSLLATVDYCNQPLGLGPLTYQLHLAHSSLSNIHQQLDGVNIQQNEQLSELQETQLEMSAHPLSGAQLSPVFLLAGFTSATLVSLIKPMQIERLGAPRLAVRVCDQLQSCRLFYSEPLASWPPLELTSSREELTGLLNYLQSGLMTGWRSDRAGNSEAGVAALAGPIRLASQSIEWYQQQQLERPPEKLDTIRKQMLVAVRDCLHYSSRLLQSRSPVPPNSAQTNLLMDTLSHILSTTIVTQENKLRAFGLMAQLLRRSIKHQQQNPKRNCLAELNFLQTGYHSLLSTFNHYSLINQNTSNSNNQEDLAAQLATSSEPQPPALSKHKAATARHKHQQTLMAYLKSVRHELRHLLGSAAMQLPLGDAHQFHFAQPVKPKSKVSTQSEEVEEPASDIVSSLSHVSSLTEQPIQIELLEFGSLIISFGSEFVSKLKQLILSDQLICRKTNSSFEPVESICASFVLVLTTYAGKSPYRALDSALRVPLLEISLLSPVDGSDLLELQDEQLRRSLKLELNFKPPKWIHDQRPNELDSTQSSDESKPLLSRLGYKCYQFDEAGQEWKVASVNQSNNLKALTCTYHTLGAFALFRGQPSQASEQKMPTLAISLMAAIAISVFLLLLAGLAWSSR